MLEVLYDKTTKEVRGWCGDPNQFGEFVPLVSEDVVILSIDPPLVKSDWYKVDLVNKKLVGNPVYIPIPPRNLAAEIDEIKQGIGIGSAGEKGIAQRIDALEARIAVLEKP